MFSRINLWYFILTVVHVISENDLPSQQLTNQNSHQLHQPNFLKYLRRYTNRKQNPLAKNGLFTEGLPLDATNSAFMTGLTPYSGYDGFSSFEPLVHNNLFNWTAALAYLQSMQQLQPHQNNNNQPTDQTNHGNANTRHPFGAQSKPWNNQQKPLEPYKSYGYGGSNYESGYGGGNGGGFGGGYGGGYGGGNGGGYGSGNGGGKGYGGGYGGGHFFNFPGHGYSTHKEDKVRYIPIPVPYPVYHHEKQHHDDGHKGLGFGLIGILIAALLPLLLGALLLPLGLLAALSLFTLIAVLGNGAAGTLIPVNGTLVAGRRRRRRSCNSSPELFDKQLLDIIHSFVLNCIDRVKCNYFDLCDL